MNCINPTEQVLAAYTSETDDANPIVILNLLKLKEKVEVDGKTVHGKEAYKRYSLGATKIAWQCGGQVLWMGKVKFTLIAPEGEKWDQVIMLHFPSRSHFLQMLHSPE
ncbi:MAG: DUF1330 domain-containing protein, partial [Deferribacteres bacterium]|nr:DUF1330 domain-containing protein [Deferribacteres bacterium]